MTIERLELALKPYGLRLRGVAPLNQDEIQNYGFADYASLVLVGNIGSSFWSVFSQSPEYADGKVDPLDRWSKRVAEELAPGLNAAPVFPFQGPPYLPFQQWVKRAEALYQSPLGLMIHPQYGLWHAYRFALLIPETLDALPVKDEAPCINCQDQPCLNTCPVGAISVSGYDIDRCGDYLNSNPEADCFQHGCMARYMCPAGRRFRYLDKQSQFHLKAFSKLR